MRISIEIEDNKVCNFTKGALQEFNSQSKKVIENLIDEACRVETVRREPDTRQEITQADVIDGARFSPKKPSAQKGNMENSFKRIVSSCSGCIWVCF